MKFDDFDKEMRVYEESLDQYILPDMYIAARLDGRSFTRLTKEVCQFEAPFDIRFRDLMVNTVKALMDAGFRIIYGYTESDEISLLFHPEDNTFGRKVRKINTTLAGEASATFSLALGQTATFDCRVIPLPNSDRVADYFLWRQEDSHRNSLNAHCYWALRREGINARKATSMLEGMEREKRHGTVEQVDECTWKFTADVYDASEMLPWIRTFTGRIDHLECSNEFVVNRFREDLSALARMYGGDGDAVQ